MMLYVSPHYYRFHRGLLMTVLPMTNKRSSCNKDSSGQRLPFVMLVTFGDVLYEHMEVEVKQRILFQMWSLPLCCCTPMQCIAQSTAEAIVLINQSVMA